MKPPGLSSTHHHWLVYVFSKGHGEPVWLSNVETNNQHIPPIDMEAHRKFQSHLSSRLGLYYIIQGNLRSKTISEDPKNPIG